jgi:hypothetical protein
MSGATSQSRWTWLRRAAAVIAVALVSSVAATSAAHAHATYVTHPDGSRAYINDSHTTVTICDNDPDGHYAYIRFTTYIGTTEALYDNDGYGGKCSDYPVQWYHVAFNACVQYESCGQPKYRPGWGTPIW